MANQYTWIVYKQMVKSLTYRMICTETSGSIGKSRQRRTYCRPFDWAVGGCRKAHSQNCKDSRLSRRACTEQNMDSATTQT
jgi:hypothetical protein